MSPKVRIVSATRASAGEFESNTELGRSMSVLRRLEEVELDITFNNAEGLPAVYNRAIDKAKDDPAILVFVHDDVYIADTLWLAEIRRCLTLVNIVGIAGNHRRVPNQPNWAFARIDNGKFVWDEPQYLSGVVGYGAPPGELTMLGPVHVRCKLLDGLLLAADSQTLDAKGLRFDPRFTFHFYDMDFCRQADALGLTMGTALIRVIHRSEGSFDSPAWRASYETYLKKYGD
jgi:GT2 family glycosyltransferase